MLDYLSSKAKNLGHHNTMNFSPHHCVGFLFFAWIPPLSSVRRRRAPHSLTHSHSLTLTHSFTHCTDSFLAAFGVAGAVHRASWRSCGARGRRWGRGCLWRGRTQYTEPPGGAAARVGAAGAAAAFRMASAVHRASWRSCGARGRRWGRGCLLRGRCSTQSLLEELRRAWAPLGPRLPFAWQAQYTEPPGGAAAGVGAAGAAAAFCVAGAVHRASWRSCGARGRRWGRGCLVAWQAQYTSQHNSSQLITYQLITAPLLTPHSSQLHCSSQLITAPLLTGPLLITTHHNLSHPNSSQFHFSHLTSHTSLITSQLLITIHHNLSHPNSSQLHFSHHFSHLTYHIRTHHSSTSHT